MPGKPREKPPKRSIFEDFQRIALANVNGPDWAYIERKARRRFSARFHTPLTEAESLTIDYILLNLYESDFEDMTPDARARAAALLTRGEEEFEEEERALDDDEAWLERESKAEAERNAARESERMRRLAEGIPRGSSVDFPPDPPAKK